MNAAPGDRPPRLTAPRAPAAPHPRTHPAAPLQLDVLLDGLTHPGRGLHTEQLHWHWHGPLDTERFGRAWQTVTDQEAVLRTGLARPAPGAAPGFAVHPAAGPLITHHRPGGGDPQAWEALLAAERMREFDLTRPGPLRIALLGGADGSTRVLLTYHRALLDPVSVGHLLRSFRRAYAADGRPRGGERRPDLRDHLQWIAARDLGPARAFWSRAAPAAGAVTLPAGDRGQPTHQRGHGRTRQRLSPAEAGRLRAWAAGLGAAESTALQAAWAMLLYRARGGPEAVPVAFAAGVSGRGIPLEGAGELPGPLGNALPVAVDVRAGATVAELLAELAGRAVDLAAYEWVSAGQIRGWAGAGAGPLTESVLAFLPPEGVGGPPAAPLPGAGPRTPAPQSPAGLDGADGELPSAAPLPGASPRTPTPQTPAGLELPCGQSSPPGGPAEVCDAYTGAAVAVTARHDRDGGLTLTVVHDRTRVADSDAAELLWQVALLLRRVPVEVGARTTVGEALLPLRGAPLPRVAADPVPVARVLRPASAAGAGVVCLLPPPGAAEDCYDRFARGHSGAPALLAAAPGAAAALAALAPALAAGEPVVIGGHPGARALAYEVAQRIAAYGWSPPPLAFGASDRALAKALAQAS
ncbi:condensation domain-containing protein [Streptomyces sp. NBC_00091]|uniref:condensation domain-containing protein n=1 Tax=Streptomyces sp. NBC_00091 TaxID=2975648 RepID=UPI002251EA2C|nr:condensation domain-containing protein [Streptomyces sp. NBC_00091]MCX5381174.1 condensation domain-containing protein [Streptomyces sp. NBC_00091]